jgi:hypothetical protein
MLYYLFAYVKKTFGGGGLGAQLYPLYLQEIPFTKEVLFGYFLSHHATKEEIS